MLQSFRNYLLKNRFLPFFVATIFMFASCSKGNGLTNTPSSTKSTSVNSYSGIQMLDGIIFGQGDVAKKMGTDKNEVTKLLSNASDINAFLAAKQDLYQKILAKDPNYFTKFKAEMESGDLNRIKKELGNVGNVFKNALDVNLSKETLVKITTGAKNSNIDYKELLGSKNTQENLKVQIQQALVSPVTLTTPVKKDDHGSLIVFVTIIAVVVVVFAVLGESEAVTLDSANGTLNLNDLSLSVLNNLSPQ